MVTSPQLGAKRTCPQCNARFYDLSKNPASCPKCGHSFDTSQPVRTRRPRADRRNAEAAEEDKLVAIKKPAARPAAKGRADEEEELEDVELIQGGEDIEELEEIEDIEDIEDIDATEDEPLDDDITLEDEDIGDEALIDNVDEAEEEAEEEEAEEDDSPKGGRGKNRR